MGVSSQRLIIMVIMINLMIGAVSVIYHNPTSQDLSIFTTFTTDSDTIGNDALSDETRDSGNMNNNVLTESTAGNPLKITKIMWNVFVNAIVPCAIS